MSILIKGMEMPTNDELLFLRIYPNGKVTIDMDLECKQIATAVPVLSHGRLIDADEFLKRAIGTKCFRGDYALMLEELVGESTTIIPAEEGK